MADCYPWPRSSQFFSLSIYRALHWVTPQMLCVPIDEEIQEVSDVVVKAITGMLKASGLTPSPWESSASVRSPLA